MKLTSGVIKPPGVYIGCIGERMRARILWSVLHACTLGSCGQCCTRYPDKDGGSLRISFFFSFFFRPSSRSADRSDVTCVGQEEFPLRGSTPGPAHHRGAKRGRGTGWGRSRPSRPPHPYSGLSPWLTVAVGCCKR